MFANGETVTRQRAGVRQDPYSLEPTEDWDNPQPDVTIHGVAFDPGGSLEPSEVGRTSVVTQPTVYDPSVADVTARDRLVVRGVIYQVDGQPAHWRSPFTGWSPGQVIKLKVVEG